MTRRGQTDARRRIGLVLLSVALLLAPAACRRAQDPNIVLITLDTMRADRLGAMGDRTAHTPTLDRLAARGVLFERAYASAPLTLPSHATILTGLDPNRHGVHDNGRFTVPARFASVAERLAARGYATAAFVAAFVLDARFGLNQGFAVYDDRVPGGRDPLLFTVPRRRGAEVTEHAIAWLRKAHAPFFLWVHYYDVHAPRRPPPPFDRLADPYAGAVAYVDAQIARLLTALRAASARHPLLTIVVGDHGESLGEKEEATHGIVAYDGTLHVPLIVAGPGFSGGIRSRSFVRTADIAPTIRAAVGEMAAPQMSGRPLQQAVAGHDDPPGYFECFGPYYGMGWARLAGVRTGRWKYTAEPAPAELYDVLADPGERVDRSKAEPGVVAQMARLYTRLRAPRDRPALHPLPADLRTRLEALGYLSAPEHFQPGAAPDPRRLAALPGWVDAARGLAARGRVAESIAALRILVSSPAARVLALRSLAAVYAVAGRPDDAVGALRRVSRLTGAPGSRLDLANALAAAGHFPEALRLLDKVAASEKPSERLHLLRARVLLFLDRGPAAADEAQAVLVRDPENDGAMALVSQAGAVQGHAVAEIRRLRDFLAARAQADRFPQSRLALAGLLLDARSTAEATRLLASVPDPPLSHRMLLADIANERGNRERALAIYESLATAHPASAQVRRALAEAYAAAGRPADALRQYDRLIAVNPRDATLLVDRGVSRQALGKSAGAETDYRQALAIDPDLPEALLDLALLELDGGREDDAEKHLQRALQIRPDYAKAHFHLARLYTRRGDPRAAREASQAVATSAGNPPRHQEVR